ncbi:zinc-finger domain-containing protein, partial [Bacillus thuringiensis]|nr:zinc-finger domain-containing protein [Bacillus thuringiensis]
MEARIKRIRILDLQDQYCQKCEYEMKPLNHCIKHCEVGRELSSLAKGMFEVRVMNTCEQWDDICQKATALYKQGLGFTKVAENLGCHTGT